VSHHFYRKGHSMTCNAKLSQEEQLSRRVFLRATGASALVGPMLTPSRASEAQSTDTPLSACAPCSLSEDHIIWGYDRKKWNYHGVMQGFPPTPENTVATTATAPDAREEGGHAKLIWRQQHWRELYPTQRIACADRPLTLVARPIDIPAYEVDDGYGSGGKTTIREFLDSTYTDAFAVLHVRDNTNYLVYEQYNNGMHREQLHVWFTVVIL
jgi:hypothetical protein